MVLHGEGQEGGFFVLGIADADVPCALVVGVEAADFAHIDEGLADAVLLQQGGDFARKRNIKTAAVVKGGMAKNVKRALGV